MIDDDNTINQDDEMVVIKESQVSLQQQSNINEKHEQSPKKPVTTRPRTTKGLNRLSPNKSSNQGPPQNTITLSQELPPNQKQTFDHEEMRNHSQTAEPKTHNNS